MLNISLSLFLDSMAKKLEHSRTGMTRVPSSNSTSIYGNEAATPTTSFKKPRIAEGSSNQQELLSAGKLMNFSTFLRPSMLLANNDSKENRENKEEQFSEKQSKSSVDHNSKNNKRKVVDTTGFCDDPLMEYSSVCSLGASNNTDIISTRKQEVDDSIYLSENNDEDIEEDAMMKEIKNNARREGNNNGVRRSKNSETHNLYERQRRDKINKKLRILKDLIPNCNKVDKASLLDDAIEYLKALKLHLQIMTMGTGLCMAPLMLPTSSPHQHLMNTTSQLQHLMGLRNGINIPLCNMPHQFASIPPIPLPPVGISNNNNNGVGMFGFPNHFLPMMTPNNHPMSHHAPAFTTTTIHPMLGNNNINKNNIFTQTPLQTTNSDSAP
ncbi:hypothetical protein PIB30_035430 [Stylosanthes scabra]|uniref:BHLH domain-containing protein n=1 Tax=Stylosanthes scabra TaxID=79078 RepID=A0ABU6SDD1_9FABA|nr:hypothetical protein [Stylosanthes scabra]